jgi:hypothetical protein
VDAAVEVASWDGVTVAGGIVRLHGRELGRIGAGRAEVRLPPRIAAMLVETGRARAGDGTHVWVPLDEPDAAVELFRLAYERAQVALRVRRDS